MFGVVGTAASGNFVGAGKRSYDWWLAGMSRGCWANVGGQRHTSYTTLYSLFSAFQVLAQQQLNGWRQDDRCGAS